MSILIATLVVVVILLSIVLYQPALIAIIAILAGSALIQTSGDEYSMSRQSKHGGRVMNPERPPRLPFHKAKEYLSPDFQLKSLTHPRGFPMTLIDESHLFGGSKQRVLIGLLADIMQNEVVYAGPAGGYAQIALSYCCRLIGKRATIYTDVGEFQYAPLVAIARALDAKIIYYDITREGKRLKHIQEQAEKYVASRSKEAYLIPFGLHSPAALDLYVAAFSRLSPPAPPKRMWIVAGSGMIVTALSRVWPDCHFMIVQVGKKLWPDQLEQIKHTLWVSPYRFEEDMKEELPFNTPRNYDGKLWPFVVEHGQQGDFIWNTAGAPRTINDCAAEFSRINKMLAVAAEEERAVVTKAKKMELPLFARMMPDPTTMFATLKREIAAMPPDNDVRRNFSRDYFRADGISNHWTEPVRMHCIVNRPPAINMYEYWRQRRDEIAREAYWLGATSAEVRPGSAWRDAMTALKCYECNTFNPFIVAAAIRNYFAGEPVIMLDPSMGWGDRLIGALAMGARAYVGFDPNKNLASCYPRIVADLKCDTTTRFITDKFAYGLIPPDYAGKFDLALTSPPFFDQEVYEGTEADVAKSYAQWIRDMYEPFIRDMARSIRVGGIVAVYIENTRAGNMADDTNRILKSYEVGDEHLVALDTIWFHNDSDQLNGLTKPGHPKSMWIYKKETGTRAPVTKGGDVTTYPRCNYDVQASQEYARLVTVNKLVAEATRFARKLTADGGAVARAIIERMLLTFANRAAVECGRDPVLNWPCDLGEYERDLKYQFKSATHDALAKHIAKQAEHIKAFAMTKEFESMPRWSFAESGDLTVFRIGEYERAIATKRMALLRQMAKDANVAKMLVRYATIISGSQHWEAPIEYFRILYDLGVRFEGFSSPINSNFILPEFKDTRICTLFPDTDAPWRSIGGFFQTDFLQFWSADSPPIVVVGPPYVDELILNIARHIISHCERAFAANRAIRFIITHSNSWDYSEGFKKLKGSPFLRLDHVFAKNGHYYMNDRGERIIARFETRLFVLDAGMPGLTATERTKLLAIFPHI